MLGYLLILIAIILILGGVYIFFAKSIKYSAGLSRGLFFKGIAGLIGAKEAEYELKGSAKILLAAFLIVSGLFVLILAILNIKYIT